MTIVKRESYRFKVPSKCIVKSQRGHHVVVKVNILCDECRSILCDDCCSHNLNLA